MKTVVTIGLTFAEASAIQERLETLHKGPVREVLARVLREFIVNAGSQKTAPAPCTCHREKQP